MSHRDINIIAIHGAGMHARVWRNLAEHLEFPFQALSLPGHGESAGPLLHSIEKMSEWVNARLDGYSPQSIVLTGHSMGALVAMESAMHASVAAVALLGVAAAMPVHPELLREAAENPAAAADLVLKWGVSSNRLDADALRSDLKAHMNMVAGGALLNDLQACADYRHGETMAGNISKPVLVISGQDDKMARPADGKILAGMINGAQFRIIPECGHMLMAEKPAETAKEINGFIAALDY